MVLSHGLHGLTSVANLNVGYTATTISAMQVTLSLGVNGLYRLSSSTMLAQLPLDRPGEAQIVTLGLSVPSAFSASSVLPFSIAQDTGTPFTPNSSFALLPLHIIWTPPSTATTRTATQ